jgi:hypothetical protein
MPACSYSSWSKFSTTSKQPSQLHDQQWKVCATVQKIKNNSSSSKQSRDIHQQLRRSMHAIWPEVMPNQATQSMPQLHSLKCRWGKRPQPSYKNTPCSNTVTQRLAPGVHHHQPFRRLM